MDVKGPSAAVRSLDNFNSHTAGRHDPGQIIVLFDHRHIKPAEDKMSTFTSYYLDGLNRLGWASYWNPPDLDPGKIRLVWYTHAGVEGHRDYDLWKAYAVKEMLDSLSEQGFRPMIIGWSGENPFPMIGGSEPPPEPKKPKMRVATSASGTISGHAGASKGTTPHDRVMKIIEMEEEREAKKRAEEVERGKKAEALGVGV